MRVRAAFFVCLGAFGVACQIIANIGDKKIYQEVDGNVDPCATDGTPGNPGLNTSSTSDNVKITAALSSIMIGATDGGPYYGFNIDKTCTCDNGGIDSC